MEQDIFDIIKEKEFDQLTADEQLQVAECCDGEDEFYNMKNVLNEVEMFATVAVTPSAKTKMNLDHLFDEIHKTKSRLWYSSVGAFVLPKNKPFYQQPLLYAAAVLFVLFMIFPFNQNQFEQVIQIPVVAQQTENPIPNKDELTTNSNAEVLSEESGEASLMQESVVMADLPNEISGESTVVASGGMLEEVAALPEHPDGVFESWAEEGNISLPVSRQPDVLDLLAVTF